jgi:hypothetical protein|tara:strand:+ start:672 stop:1007 length:336 start_codon:yes stop_codon:yes gene_type:complete
MKGNTMKIYEQEREELKAKVVELERKYYQRYSKDELISLAIGNRDYEGCCVGYRDNEVIRRDVMELKKKIPLYDRPDVWEWFDTTSLTTDDFTEEELLFLSKIRLPKELMT